MGLFAALIGAVALASVSGAATTKAQKVARIDVSSRVAAIRYLRSIHVNLKGLVVQRGARNYAGAHCPGKGWICTTTTHPVVQVASVGGKNTFSCATASCAVVQVAPHAPTLNTAKCIKTTGLSQSCTISQSSSTGNNVAIVYENATKASGLTQTATSTATITQRATSSGTNRACVLQNIDMTGSTTAKKGTPVNVTLEAHQTVTVKQDSLSGANSAAESATPGGVCTGPAVTQTQALRSTANGSGLITQNENAANSGANMTIDVEQNQSAGFLGSASGANSAVFNQTNTLTAVANSPAGPISQTQSSVNGGLLGTVNQDSTGLSTATTTQTETQCEDAAKTGLTACGTSDADAIEAPSSLTQIQFGPVHKGVGEATQTGNNGDSFTVTQSSTQDNDQGGGSQQSNVVQGDCHTPGNCTVSQTTSVDGTTTTNTQSGQDVSTQTTCTGDNCTSGGPSTTGTLTLLPNGLSVSNTDVGEFGQGGMRGSGTSSIDISGITGPVLHAFLYWHGPTNSTNPNSNASVTFKGSPVTGTNIGTASDNNWGFLNSQSYRADVTALVSGNGTYTLSNFIKENTPSACSPETLPPTTDCVADINGVALIVFYDDGNASNDRNVVLWNGNDSNQSSAFDSDTAWGETISGVEYPGSGSASLDLVVGDGQSFADGALDVNGTPVAGSGAVFQGDTGPNYSGNGSGVTGSLWDVKSFDITSLLSNGSNDLHITSPAVEDALSLVVAIANVPASAPVIG